MFFEQMYQNQKIVQSIKFTTSKKMFTYVKSYRLIGASCCSKIYFRKKLLAIRKKGGKYGK